MDIRLLGPVEACIDGRPVPLGGAKPRALFAMLALNVATTVSADRLMEGLWGEQLPPTAAKTLRAHVSRLRRALEASGDGTAIVTRAHGYELRLAPEDVDARRFERLVDRGAPREALALWRGRALEDVAAEPFAAAEIRRLEALRQAAIEQAVDGDLDAGRHRELIGELEALVADEPYREQLRGQLMLALYRSGRQADALESYRDARAALVDQIGVEPGAELQRLHEAILRHDPALAYDGEPTGRRPRGRHVPVQGIGLVRRRGRRGLLRARAAGLGDDRPPGRPRPCSDWSDRRAAASPRCCAPGCWLRSPAARYRAASAGRSSWCAPATGRCGRSSKRDAEARLILAVDQFEELFAPGVEEAERAGFIDALVDRASDERRRTLVLVALRADFYGRCAAYPELAALLSANHVLVGPMRRDELRRAIELPARGAGMTVEPQLVDALLDDVAGEPGALPLLSACLLELWKNRHGHELRMDAYESTGGLHGAVARLAESAYERLDPEQRETARRILLRLAEEGEGAGADAPAGHGG